MNKKSLQGACLIRWLGALFVMSGHMYCLMAVAPPNILWNAIQRIGIIFFFVLGGYLITGSWASDPCFRNYYIKRIVRIFPPLIVFVFVVAIIIGPLISSLPCKEYFSNPNFIGYFSNIVLYIRYTLPGVFETNPYPNAVNGSLWSLPVEVFMYVLVPFFYKIGKKSLRTCSFVVGLICCLNIIKDMWFPTFYKVVYGTDLGSMISVIPYYFIGMLIYILEEKRQLRVNFNLDYIPLILFASVMCSFGTVALIDILSFIFIPYVVFSLASIKHNMITQILSKVEVTYGIYLYGFFIQQLIIYLNYKYEWNGSFNFLFVVSLFITIIFAMASNKFIEKPIIAWSKKFLK